MSRACAKCLEDRNANDEPIDLVRLPNGVRVCRDCYAAHHDVTGESTRLRRALKLGAVSLPAEARARHPHEYVAWLKEQGLWSPGR